MHNTVYMSIYDTYSPSEDLAQKSKKAKWKRIEISRHLKFEITDDIDEAKDIVKSLLANGEKPTITIPVQYIDKITQQGIPLIPKTDLRTGRQFEVTAGRLGSPPYLDNDEERYVAEITVPASVVQPRLTGEDRIFAGTVVFNRPIQPSEIKILGKFNNQTYQEEQNAFLQAA